MGHDYLHFKPENYLLVELIHCMNEYTQLDRTIKLSYLAMIGKTGMARIAPGKPYLNDTIASKNGSLNWLR